MSGALDPTGIVSHPDEFHNGISWKRPCRVATTANITIATALNAGDSIDGVTLAAGDRVLVKNQSTGSQNGIYLAGVTPIRDFDMDQDGTTNTFDVEEIAGAYVHVLEGTANAGTLWRTTNAGGGILGTTAIVWSQVAAGVDLSGIDFLVGTASGLLSAEIVAGTTPGGELGGTWASPTVDGTHSGSAHADFIAKSLLTVQDDIIVRDGTGPARLGKGSDGQVLTVDPTTHHLGWATPSAGSGTITTKDEGSTLSSTVTTVDFVGAGVTASGAGATTTVTIPGGGGASGLAYIYLSTIAR